MRIVGKLCEHYKSFSLITKASLWFVAVTIIDKAIAVLTQPFINRILSVGEVGIYGVYNSWYSVVSIIATFNLFGGVFEEYLKYGSEIFPVYVIKNGSVEAYRFPLHL